MFRFTVHKKSGGSIFITSRKEILRHWKKQTENLKYGRRITLQDLYKIEKALSTLYKFYTYYPECRHIPTKNRTYRNIILDAHLIIYRITEERIEVLDIIHGASSIRKIRGVRKIRL